MRTTTALALVPLFLVSACNKDDAQDPRHPTQGSQDIIGESFHFKVKPDEWDPHGTPGDDTHGYAVSKNVHMISEAIAATGIVRVHLQRDNTGWVELPVLAHQGAPGGVNWRSIHRAGEVEIRLDQNGASFSRPDQVMTFKVVAFAQHELSGDGTGEYAPVKDLN